MNGNKVITQAGILEELMASEIDKNQSYISKILKKLLITRKRFSLVPN